MALVLPPAALLLAGHSMAARTPAGSTAKQQAEALRHYLAKAVPQHVDENAQGFSAMLPYAMVLGLEDRWTRTFAALAAQAHGTARPESAQQWYVGPSTTGTPFAGRGDLGSAISSFSWTAGSAMTSRPSSSGSAGDSSGGGWFGGGSSGDGGGSSGGGGGGGGGGGW